MNMTPSHLPDGRLNEYLDGALSGEDRMAVEAHLAGCESCAARAQSLRGLFASLESLPEVVPDFDLAPGVLAALRPAPPVSRAWKLAAIFQFGLAALVIIFSLPSFLQSPQAQSLAQSGQQFVQAWENGILRTINDAAVAFQSALQLAGQYFQRLQSPGVIPVSLIGVWLLVAVTGVLWLVGNGLLLRNTGSRKWRKP